MKAINVIQSVIPTQFLDPNTANTAALPGARAGDIVQLVYNGNRTNPSDESLSVEPIITVNDQIRLSSQALGCTIILFRIAGDLV